MHDRWAGWRRSQSYTRIPLLGRKPAAPLVAPRVLGPLRYRGGADGDQRQGDLAGADRGGGAVATRRFAPCRHSGWLFFLFCRPGCDARRDATRSPNPRNPARLIAEDRDTRTMKEQNPPK